MDLEDLKLELVRLMWRINQLPRERKRRLVLIARQVLGGSEDKERRIALGLMEILCGDRVAGKTG